MMKTLSNSRIVAYFAILLVLIIAACSSSDPTPTLVSTSTPEITPTSQPPFSSSRPANLPAWVPDDLWNQPVLEPRFPPPGAVEGFTGWDGDGIFSIPEDVQPDSAAASVGVACELPTSAFPDYLIQVRDGELDLTLIDLHWRDYMSPTGYEYYECVYDVTGEVTMLRAFQPPGAEQQFERFRMQDVLTAELPEWPVVSTGLRPGGPCQFPFEWEGFNGQLVRGGAELLPSGIIKLSCLYKNSPQAAATPEQIAMVLWPANAFEIAGFGPRRLPPLILRADERQMDTEDLTSAWRGHLEQVVVADNQRGTPVVRLCRGATGVWLGTEQPWDQIPFGSTINWRLESPGSNPDHPESVFETANAAVLGIGDDLRGFREKLPFSAGTTTDDGIIFVITELKDPSLCTK